MQIAWPRDGNVAELVEFYGSPIRHGAADLKWASENIVELAPPYQMRFSWGPPVRVLKFHRKCRDAFGEALLAVKKLYGTQEAIEAHRLHLTGGSWVVRLKRGSINSWSIHAYGAAIDMDPEHNPFPAKWRKGFIPIEAAKCFQDCGLIWRGADGDDDPMHFQAARRP